MQNIAHIKSLRNHYRTKAQGDTTPPPQPPPQSQKQLAVVKPERNTELFKSLLQTNRDMFDLNRRIQDLDARFS